MNTDYKILFIMPVLRTTDYTRLAYTSFKANSNSNHDIRICLDLDVEEDKEFYRKEGIPFDVFHGWGHWLMACHYVKQILEGKLDYQYVGLIHNDMVFGHQWLAPFDAFVQSDTSKTLFCFDQENPERTSMWGKNIETFDYEKYQLDTKRTFTRDTTKFFSFLPWVMSVEAFTTTFKWLAEGDAGIWIRRDFDVVQFLTRVWHFMNIAVNKHREDYLNNQTTRRNWSRHIQDPRFRELVRYLVANTAWANNSDIITLAQLSKGL